MTQPLEITMAWDEVAGEITGHIVGLPEAPIHGGQKLEDFIVQARDMVARFGYMDRDVILTNDKHEPLGLKLVA